MSQSSNLFIEFHVLRSYAPGNLNRDELGTPKTAIFGDERRLRISSQCLKRTWRTSDFFRGVFAREALGLGVLGVRTKQLPLLVREVLEKEGVKPEALAGMNELLQQIGRGDSEGGGEADPDKTAHLLFLANEEIEAVREFARKNRDDLTKLAAMSAPAPVAETLEGAAEAEPAATPTKGKAKGKAKPKGADPEARKELVDSLRKRLGAFLKENAPRNAVDVALFGRFVTSDEFRTVDAALQVAHALGTQRVEVEYDYFSAVDDRAESQRETGAGHIGESEFAASVFYEYAVCDWALLAKNLAGDTGLAAKSMEAVGKAIARAVPKGKKNGTAPQNPADYVEVVVRRDAPISLTNAFIRPVRHREGSDVMAGSIRALRESATGYAEAYSEPGDVVGRYVLCLRDGFDAEDGETRCKSLGALTTHVATALQQAGATE